MKGYELFKKILPGLLISFYLGSVGGNMVSHGLKAWHASGESKKTHYGDNLKQQWKNYSKLNLERITNPKILIPYSSIFIAKHKPLEIDVVGFGKDHGMKFNVCVDEKEVTTD
jgi:hypothetical protein